MPPHVNIETLLEYYKILGIDPLINDADFRAAYKAKILEHHPDKREDGNDEMFKCVQKAYEALKDISNRKHYDSMVLLHRANTGWRTPKLSSRVSTAKRTQSATNVKVRMTQPTRPMGTNTPRPTTQRTPNKTSPRPTEPIHRTSSARPPGRKPQATTNHRPVESCDPHFPKHYSIITPLNHVLEDGTQCTFDISSEALGGALRNGDIVMDGNGTSGIIVGAGFDGIYWCETGTGHASFFGNFKNPSFTFRKIGHLKGSAGAARARCDHLAKKQREDLEKFKSKQQKKNEEVLLKRKQELHMLQQLQSLEALEEKHRRDMWTRTEAYWSEVFQKLQAEGENVLGYSAHTTSTKFNADNTPLSARQTGKDSSSSSSTSNSSMNKGAGTATPIRSVPLTFSRGATNDPRTSRGSTNVTPRTPIRSSQYGRVKQESSGVRTAEASSFTSHFQRINTHRTPTKASTPNTKYYPSSQNKPRPAECTPGTFRATNSANHATLNPQRKAVTPTFRRVASARPASGKEGTYEARMRGACPPVRNSHIPSCPVTADLGRSNTMGQRETAPLPVPQRSSIVSQKSRNLARHSNQAANPAPLISPRTLFTPRGPAPCPISKIISPDHLNKLNQDSETHISSRRTNLMGADAGDIVPRRPIPAPTTTADLQRTSPKEPLNKVEVYGENIPPLNFLHSAPTSSGGSPSTTPRKKESNSIIHDTNQNTTNPLEQLSLNRGLSTILTNGPRLCTDTFVIHPPKYRSPALRSPGEHSDSSAMYSPAMGEKYHSKTSRAKQSDIDRF